MISLPPPVHSVMYDSTTPGSLPKGEAAVYANGAYSASPSQVTGHPSVLWIDTNGSDPHANVLDVEPGDATPATAGEWVAEHAKVSSSPAVVYTMRSDWDAVKYAVHHDAPSAHVQWWIADPTGIKHLVPGSSATQWAWDANYDISEITAGFGQEVPAHHAAIHRASAHVHAAVKLTSSFKFTSRIRTISVQLPR